MDFKKTIVHIGCFSYIPGSQNGPALEVNTEYLCFELRDRFKGFLEKTYLEMPENHKENVKLIFSSARDTGLQSESVDEVHMYNVIGDPSVSDIGDFFRESYRILKPEKSLFIGETISPYPIENLVLGARKNNFGMKIIVPHPLEHISAKELERFYTIMDENVNSEMYNKNFHEWYELLGNMELLGNKHLSDAERNTIKKYRGSFDFVCGGSYLVQLIKK